MNIILRFCVHTFHLFYSHSFIINVCIGGQYYNIQTHTYCFDT